MKRATSPSAKGFRGLSYSQKFTIITLVFLIPVIAFAPLISDQVTNINRYGVSELAGTLYLRSLWKLSDALRGYVTRSYDYAAERALLSDLQAAESQVENQFSEFSEVHNQYGGSLRLMSGFDTIRQQWLEVKSSVMNEDWQSFESRQLALFESISALTSQAGDSSYLILDPDLDTYYMMDTVLIKAPDNQSILFQTYKIAEEAMAQGSFSMEDQNQLIALIGRLEANLDAMNRNIGVALQDDETGAMGLIISAPLQQYQAKLRAFTGLVSGSYSNPIAAESAGASSAIEELEDAYRAAFAAESELYDAASASLELGIQNRINRLQQRLTWMVLIAIIGITTAFLIGRSMMRSISQPLSVLIRATNLLSTGDMSSRVALHDPSEIGQVGVAFNLMAEELEKDKTALIARSAELALARNQSEKRARDLQAISEISRTISSEQRFDVLLPLISRMVSEKLGFHHVGFFLLDNSHTFAILQATNSEHGQHLLAQNYRLKMVESSSITATISTGKAQIALDAEKDQSQAQPSFVPNSRSEVALPIRLSGELIGALDIQSTEENAFSFDDLEIFEVLASQVGIAIQNARLYEQNVQALKDIEEAYRKLSGSTWRGLIRQTDVKAYAYDGVSSRPVAEALSGYGSSVLSVPVTVRGQVVGNLRLNPLDPNRSWTEDEIAITRAVAERAALAMEAARLLEDAQKRASRESFLSEMASKLSTSFQLDSILRDTVEELGQSLSGSTVSFQLVDPSAPPVREVQDEFIRAEWSRTVSKAEQPGFRYHFGRIEMLENPLDLPEVASAVQSGQIEPSLDSGSTEKRTQVAVPVKIRGEVIGVIHVESNDSSRIWKDDEIRLVEAVAERAALAMENARLFQDARRRAAKEQAISQATTRISSAINMENILHTTAEELERVLGGSEVLIRFQNKERS